MQGLGHDYHHEQRVWCSGEGWDNECEQCNDEVDQRLGYDGVQVVGSVRVENRRRTKSLWKFVASVCSYEDICFAYGWVPI